MEQVSKCACARTRVGWLVGWLFIIPALSMVLLLMVTLDLNLFAFRDRVSFLYPIDLISPLWKGEWASLLHIDCLPTLGRGRG